VVRRFREAAEFQGLLERVVSHSETEKGWFFDGCPGFELGWVRVMTGSPDVTLSGLHDLAERLNLATHPGDRVDEGGQREYEEIGFHGC
jgi:hypothetical protein